MISACPTHPFAPVLPVKGRSLPWPIARQTINYFGALTTHDQLLQISVTDPTNKSDFVLYFHRVSAPAREKPISLIQISRYPNILESRACCDGAGIVKKHIAFINLPRPSHINATLPIVSTLVRRGHRVTYATSEQFSARITRAGAQYMLIPSMDMRAMRDDLVCHTAAETVKAVTPCFEMDTPDVIVYDPLAMAGRVLAHQWSLPAIKISPDSHTVKKPFLAACRADTCG
jgi:hypothetical protein